MKNLLLPILFCLLTACGVTAGNPGSPTPKASTYELHGEIATLEPHASRVFHVRVLDAFGEVAGYATSTTTGIYRVQDLQEGYHEVHVESLYRQGVWIDRDIVMNFLLPLPTAPLHFRFVELGPRDLCLLWEDRSGLEAGFIVESENRVIDVPANRVGLRIYLPNFPHGDDNLPDYEKTAEVWNDAFSGLYAIVAWNEYGDSVSISTEVPPYALEQWSTEEPPTEPPKADGDPDRQQCLSVERYPYEPVFIFP